MTTFAVFDIDGTVADDRDRRHFISDTTDPVARYILYHEAMETDPVINTELVSAAQEKRCKIVFATSRPDRYHQRTVDWLRKHFPRIPVIRLLMRKAGDFRPSPEVKVDMVDALAREGGIAIVYDDREDVVLALRRFGFNAELVTFCGTAPSETHLDTAPDAILRKMAETYAERSNVYGNNLLMVQPIAEILFPAGVPTFSTKMHLFELLLMKLTRFAVSGLTHTDSIHDIGVYAAMLESHIKENDNE
jgi:hypothetical protein